MDVASPASGSRLKRPNLLPYYRIAAILMVAVVLVQALTAGRGLSGDLDYFDTHEIVANLVMLDALILLGLAIALGAPAAWRTVLLVTHVLLVVLVFGQVALGYSYTETAATRRSPGTSPTASSSSVSRSSSSRCCRVSG